MRVLTIGRSDDCNIIISDVQNLISRRHALLRFHPLGKMELVPLGQNGTYMNGKLLRNDVPHKVSKSDVISFAHVKQLDWGMVTNPYRVYYWVIGAIVAFFMLLLMILWLRPILPSMDFGSKPATEIPLMEGGGGGVVQSADSASAKTDVAPADTVQVKEKVQGGKKQYKESEKKKDVPEQKESDKETEKEHQDDNINIIL